jgi:hypothetical protein
MNSKLITRDASFDSYAEQTLQYEDQLKLLLVKADQLQTSLQDLSNFSSDIAPLTASLLTSSELHCKLLAEAGEVHSSLSSLFADSVRSN